MNKKQIIIGVILLVSIASITFLVINNKNKKTEDKKESPVENGTIKDDIELENITFTDVKLKSENGITTVTANVKSKKAIKSATVKIIFLDEAGKELKNTIQIIEDISSKEKVFTTGFIGSYESTTKVKFELVKEA